MNNSKRVQGGEVSAVRKGSRSDGLAHVPFHRERKVGRERKSRKRKYDYKSLSFFACPSLQ